MTTSPETMAAAALSMTPSGYAGLAAERMLSECPGLLDRFGERAFSSWKEDLTGRVRELAAALQSESPSGFARDVSWARVSFESRSHDIDDLKASLRCLRDVLGEELSGSAASVVSTYIDVALETLAKPHVAPADGLCADTPNGRISMEYLEFLLGGDRANARSAVLSAVDDGRLSVHEAYTEVLLPAQREIGRLWHQNEVGIPEEHFVTATTRTVMDQLVNRAAMASPLGISVMTAAVEGNAHDIAIQAVADMFEIAGWKVINLGGNVPGEDIAIAARDFSVDLVALSATLEVQRAAVASTISALRPVSDARVLVGGPAFEGPDTRWESVGADGFAQSAVDAARVGASLIGHAAAG